MLRITALLLAACFLNACDLNPDKNRKERIDIGGTIFPFATSAVDSDVNDPFATLINNNSISNAQVLPNPVTLGGYLNLPGRGLAGATFTVGDTVDIYEIDLLPGQTITLRISENATENDLELLLVDGNFSLINGSFGNGNTETLTLSESDLAGSYYVAIVMCGGSRDVEFHCFDSLPLNYKGASNYVLSVGQGLAAATAQSPTLSDAFLPGELLVKHKISGASARASLLKLAAASASTAEPHKPTSYSRLNSKLRAHMSDHARSKLDTLMALKKLRLDPAVEYAEPNYIRQPLGLPQDPKYPQQWHYPLINLPQAWDINTGSSTVVIALVDTGVLLNHPDLQGRFVSGYDFVSNLDSALDGDGIDSNADDPGDQIFNGSSSFHGTHVAGIIGASTSAPSATDSGIGVAGVNWQSKIMPLRALGHLGGTSYDIQQAILYAAGLPNDSGQVPAQTADIINLSLGAPLASQTEQDTINQAVAQGIMVVAAAGNESSSVPIYPASYDGVISVSAVDINKQAAPYANRGEFIDITAPGGNNSQDINGDGFGDGILSTSATDFGELVEYGYSYQNGTSMAAPHVSGILGLMKSIDSSLDSAALEGYLTSNQLTEDLGDPGRDNIFGWGLIDAYKAVQAAGGQASGPPFLYTAFTGLNFSYNVNSLSFSINRGGAADQAITVSAATENATWLSLIPPSNGTALGTYVAAVDRTGLAEGTYHTTISITSSVNNIDIPVLMQVADAQVGINAGYTWIVLVDPIDAETIAFTSSEVNAGQYNYLFKDVPPGDYLIIAGTDLDNDGFICDSGEACGAYPTLDVLSPVHIDDKSLTDINFHSGFNTIISLASTPNSVIPSDGINKSKSVQQKSVE